MCWRRLSRSYNSLLFHGATFHIQTAPAKDTRHKWKRPFQRQHPNQEQRIANLPSRRHCWERRWICGCRRDESHVESTGATTRTAGNIAQDEIVIIIIVGRSRREMEDIWKIHVSSMQTIALSGDIVHSQRHKDRPPTTDTVLHKCVQRSSFGHHEAARTLSLLVPFHISTQSVTSNTGSTCNEESFGSSGKQCGDSEKVHYRNWLGWGDSLGWVRMGDRLEWQEIKLNALTTGFYRGNYSNVQGRLGLGSLVSVNNKMVSQLVNVKVVLISIFH